MSSARTHPSKKEPAQFDYNTISDVILHIRYTAREGGGLLRKEAVKNVATTIEAAQVAGSVRLFSVRHEFPTGWHRFLHPKETDTEQVLSLNLIAERFPFLFQGRSIQISQIELFVSLQENVAVPAGDLLPVSVTSPDGSTVNQQLSSSASFLNGMPHAVMVVSSIVGDSTDIWTLSAQKADIVARLNRPDAIEDIIMVGHYSATR